MRREHRESDTRINPGPATQKSLLDHKTSIDLRPP